MRTKILLLLLTIGITNFLYAQVPSSYNNYTRLGNNGLTFNNIVQPGQPENNAVQFSTRCYQLSDGSANAGEFTRVWFPSTVDLSSAFRVDFTFHTGDQGSLAGEGFAFVIQGDNRGTDAISDKPYAFGTGTLQNSKISPSINLEFDLYQGQNACTQLEPSYDHAALFYNGNVCSPENLNTPSGNVTTARLHPTKNDISDGTCYAATIVWIPNGGGSHTLELYINGGLVLKKTGNITNESGFSSSQLAAANIGFIATQNTNITSVQTICLETNATVSATNDSYNVNADTTISLPVLKNDINTLATYLTQITTPPSNGSVSIVGDSLVYVPNIYFSGKDSLQYQICDVPDGTSCFGKCDTAWVNINVGCKKFNLKKLKISNNYKCDNTKPNNGSAKLWIEKYSGGKTVLWEQNFDTEANNAQNSTNSTTENIWGVFKNNAASAKINSLNGNKFIEIINTNSDITNTNNSTSTDATVLHLGTSYNGSSWSNTNNLTGRIITNEAKSDVTVSLIIRALGSFETEDRFEVWVSRNGEDFSNTLCNGTCPKVSGNFGTYNNSFTITPTTSASLDDIIIQIRFFSNENTEKFRVEYAKIEGTAPLIKEETTDGYDFNWYYANNTNVESIILGHTATSMKDSLYTVLVQKQNTNCSQSDTLLIKKITNNPYFQLKETHPLTNCANPDGELQVSIYNSSLDTATTLPVTDYEINWYYDLEQISYGSKATSLSAFPYKVIVKNNISGCQSEKSKTVTSTQTIPVITANVTQHITSCVNPNSGIIEAQSLGVNGNLDYKWYSGTQQEDEFIIAGESNNILTNRRSGNYICVGINASNCESLPIPLQIRDSTDRPSFSLSHTNNTFCVGQNVLLGNGSITAQVLTRTSKNYTYNFYRGLSDVLSLPIPNQNTGYLKNTLLAAPPGRYTVKVTEDSSGCSSTDTTSIRDLSTPPYPMDTNHIRRNNNTSCDIFNKNGMLDASNALQIFDSIKIFSQPIGIDYKNNNSNGGFNFPLMSLDGDNIQEISVSNLTEWLSPKGTITYLRDGNALGIDPYRHTNTNSQFIKVNDSIVYYDIITSPGSKFEWKLAYTQTIGLDYLLIKIGSPSSANFEKQLQSVDAWEKDSGFYVVPEGQYVTRFILESQKTLVGEIPDDNTRGSFVDAVSFKFIEYLNNGNTKLSDFRIYKGNPTILVRDNTIVPDYGSLDGIFHTLQNGRYSFLYRNNITGCQTNPYIFDIKTELDTPQISFRKTNHTSCSIPNGSITLKIQAQNDNATTQYSIRLTAPNGTDTTVVAYYNPDSIATIYTFQKLNGTVQYSITAINQSSKCSTTPINVTILKDDQIIRFLPHKISKNTSCDINSFNGKIKIFIRPSPEISNDISHYTINWYNPQLNNIYPNASSIVRIETADSLTHLNGKWNGAMGATYYVKVKLKPEYGGCESEYTPITVRDSIINPVLSTNLVKKNNSCFGGTPTGVISVNVLNALNNPHTYQWEKVSSFLYLGDSNRSVLSGLDSGTYKVKVTNTYNNCIDSTNITVVNEQIKPILDSIVTTPNTGCTISNGKINVRLLYNNTIITSDTNNFIFQWRENSGAIISNTKNTGQLRGGNYTLRVIHNETKCASDIVDAFLLDKLKKPTFSINRKTNSICDTAVTHKFNGVLKAIPTNAQNSIQNYQYKWYYAQNIDINNPEVNRISSTDQQANKPYIQSNTLNQIPTSQTYIVNIADNINGCDTTFFVLNVTDSIRYPEYTSFQNESAYPVNVCTPSPLYPNGSIGLQNIVNGTGNYDYQWYWGTTIPPLSSKKIFNGDTITHKKGSVRSTSTTTIATVQGADTTFIQNLDTGYYTLRVVDENTGCRTRDTVLHVTSDRDALTIELQANTLKDNTNCTPILANDNAEITFDILNEIPNRKYNWNWYTGSDIVTTPICQSCITRNLSNISQNTYTVKVTDSVTQCFAARSTVVKKSTPNINSQLKNKTAQQECNPPDGTAVVEVINNGFTNGTPIGYKPEYTYEWYLGEITSPDPSQKIIPNGSITLSNTSIPNSHITRPYTINSGIISMRNGKDSLIRLAADKYTVWVKDSTSRCEIIQPLFITIDNNIPQKPNTIFTDNGTGKIKNQSFASPNYTVLGGNIPGDCNTNSGEIHTEINGLRNNGIGYKYLWYEGTQDKTKNATSDSLSHNTLVTFLQTGINSSPLLYRKDSILTSKTFLILAQIPAGTYSLLIQDPISRCRYQESFQLRFLGQQTTQIKSLQQIESCTENGNALVSIQDDTLSVNTTTKNMSRLGFATGRNDDITTFDIYIFRNGVTPSTQDSVARGILVPKPFYFNGKQYAFPAKYITNGTLGNFGTFQHNFTNASQTNTLQAISAGDTTLINNLPPGYYTAIARNKTGTQCWHYAATDTIKNKTFAPVLQYYNPIENNICNINTYTTDGKIQTKAIKIPSDSTQPGNIRFRWYNTFNVSTTQQESGGFFKNIPNTPLTQWNPYTTASASINTIANDTSSLLFLPRGNADVLQNNEYITVIDRAIPTTNLIFATNPQFRKGETLIANNDTAVILSIKNKNSANPDTVNIYFQKITGTNNFTSGTQVRSTITNKQKNISSVIAEVDFYNNCIYTQNIIIPAIDPSNTNLSKDSVRIVNQTYCSPANGELIIETKSLKSPTKYSNDSTNFSFRWYQSKTETSQKDLSFTNDNIGYFVSGINENPSVLNILAENTARIKNKTAGYYYVYAEHKNTGCKTQPIELQINPNLTYPNINISIARNDDYCKTGNNGNAKINIQLTALQINTKYFYRWFNGIDSQSPNLIRSGKINSVSQTINPTTSIYTDSLIGIKGGNTRYYTIQVIDSLGNGLGCSSEATLQIPSFNNPITLSNSTNYTITNNTNCTSATPNGEVNITSVNQYNTNQPTGPYSFTWRKNGTSVTAPSIVTDNIFVNSRIQRANNGTYSVTVKNDTTQCTQAISLGSIINNTQNPILNVATNTISTFCTNSYNEGDAQIQLNLTENGTTINAPYSDYKIKWYRANTSSISDTATHKNLFISTNRGSTIINSNDTLSLAQLSSGYYNIKITKNKNTPHNAGCENIKNILINTSPNISQISIPPQQVTPNTICNPTDTIGNGSITFTNSNIILNGINGSISDYKWHYYPVNNTNRIDSIHINRIIGETTKTIADLPTNSYIIKTTKLTGIGKYCTVNSTSLQIQSTGSYPTFITSSVKDKGCEGGEPLGVGKINIDTIEITPNNTPYTIKWYKGIGNDTINITNLTINDSKTITNQEQGLYTLSVVNDLNNCTTSLPMYLEKDSINNAIEFIGKRIKNNDACVVTKENGTIIIDSLRFSGLSEYTYKTISPRDTFDISQKNFRFVWTKGNNIPLNASQINPQYTASNLTGATYGITVTHIKTNCVSFISEQIQNIPTYPNFTIENIKNDESCLSGEANGILKATLLEKENENHSFQWNTQDGFESTNTILNNIPANTYILTTTNNTNGCSSEQSTVLINKQPQLTINPEYIEKNNLTICEPPNGLIDIKQILKDGQNDSLQNYIYNIYSFYDGIQKLEYTSDTSLIKNLRKGQYYLQAIHKKANCPIGYTIPININDSSIQYPQIQIKNIRHVTNCNTSKPNGGIQVGTLNGNIGDYKYDWYTESGNIFNSNFTSISNLSAGTYSVLVTDKTNGCSSSQPFVILNKAVVRLNLNIVSSSPNTKCNEPFNGLVVTNILNIPPGKSILTDYHILWNPLEKGIPVGPSPNDVTIDAFVSKATYNGYTLSNLPGGTYYGKVFDKQDIYCISNYVTLIIKDEKKTPKIAIKKIKPLSNCPPKNGNAQLDAIIKNNENINLFSFEWYEGILPLKQDGTFNTELLSILPKISSSLSANNLSQKKYTLIVINNSSKCTSIDTTTVIFNPTKVSNPIIKNHANNTQCKTPNGSVELQIPQNIAQYTFDWYNQENPDQIIFSGQQNNTLDSGNYFIKTNDRISGCQSLPTFFSINKVVSKPIFQVKTKNSQCTKDNGNASLVFSEITEIDSIIWINKTQSNTYNTIEIPQAAYGNYTVQVWDKNKCTNSTEFTIGIDVFPYQIITPNNDNLNDVFVIECINQYPNNQISIYSMFTGTLVYEEKGYNNTDKVFKGISNKGLNIGNNGNLSNGTYIYHIDKGDDSSVVTGTLEIAR